MGDHLKRRRLDLRLTQGQAAERFNATEQTVCNWEKGRSLPAPRHYPAIIAFLGYDPSPKPETLGERIRAARRRQGISQRELARKLGIDPVTVWAWEAGEIRRPYQEVTPGASSYRQISGAGTGGVEIP